MSALKVSFLLLQKIHSLGSGILNDPEITRIAWDDITFGDRIGSGSAGLVSRGTLRRFVIPEQVNHLMSSRGEEIIPVAMKELLVGFELLSESAIKEFLVEIKLMRFVDLIW